MTSPQLLGYPLIPLAALELFLGILLLKQNPRNSPINKSAAACTISAAVWSLSTAFMYIRVGIGADYLFYARLSWTGWFTVPTAIQTVIFLDDEQSPKARIAGWILYPFWTGVLGMCLFTNLVVTDGYIPYPYQNSPGPLEMPLRFIGSVLVLWLIFEIIRLRKRVSGYRRVQLGWYMYGTIIFSTAGAVIGGLLQLFTGRGLEPSLGSYFSFPWVLMIFYSITRHRLFDIRLVLSRTLGILLLSFVISAILFQLFEYLVPVIGALAAIFISLPLLGLLFFGTPLSRIVQTWIDELVLRGRYRYQLMLKESANAMVTILHRDELLRYIVDSVRSGMTVYEASLYLPGPDGSFSSQHFDALQRTAGYGCVLPQGIADSLMSDGKPVVTDELAAAPTPENHDLLETCRRMEVALVLPLLFKGKMLGVLTLGRRHNDEPYLPSDIELLQTMAGHAAVALENARLFEDAGRMQASLREQEEIFRMLARTLPAALIIHRGDKFLYANNAVESLTGYPMSEFMHMNFWDVIHPEFRDLVKMRSIRRLKGDAEPVQYEFKIVRKDGDVRWALSSASQIEYEGRSAVIATLFDVTETKRAEEEKARLYAEREQHLRERIAEQERFSAILAASKEGFWISDTENRIRYVNDAYCRMSGYTRDEILSMTIDNLDSIEDRGRVDARTRRIIDKGYELFETRHRRKDGSAHDVEVSVSYYAPEKLLLSFFRDISDRKKAEEERARYHEEREKILKDLHDGIGGLTSNINLLAELAQKNDDLAQVRRSLATIAELSRESLFEIRGFLQSLDARELNWLAIAAELRSVGNTMIEPHGIRYSLTTAIGDGISGPGTIVTMNLFRIYKESLSNIIKHARASSVLVVFTVEGTKVKLDVSDNGRGIGDQLRTGRGISNMTSRAREIGGDLTVHSGAEGTTVSLSFPWSAV